MSAAGDLPALLSAAKRQELEGLLQELAAGDTALEARIRERLSHPGPISAQTLEQELAEIFWKNVDPPGEISLQQAPVLFGKLESYIRERLIPLAEADRYMDAFVLSRQLFMHLRVIKLGEAWPQGVLQALCQLWTLIADHGPQEVREELRIWITERTESGSGAILDHQLELVRYEIAGSREDLEMALMDLDDQIEKAWDRAESPVEVTHMRGRRSAVSLRIEIMRRLGRSEEEIENYRWEHRHFLEIMEDYLQEARESGDPLQEIHQLEDAVLIGADDEEETNAHRLVQLYEQTGTTCEDPQLRWLLENFLP